MQAHLKPQLANINQKLNRLKFKTCESETPHELKLVTLKSQIEKLFFIKGDFVKEMPHA